MVVPKPKRAPFFASLYRSFSSSSTRKLPIFQCQNILPSIYKLKAIEESQKALREYLHANRSLPFIFAELIANNSPFSLSRLFRKVHFSAPKFSNNFTKLLRYEPINEFEFFFESIGIDYESVPRVLPRNKFLLSEDRIVLDAAFALSRFGFPWNRLGSLYVDEISIFSKSSDVLTDRLGFLKELNGYDNLRVVGICLVFPRLLSSEGELGREDEAIIDGLKRVYRESGEGICVEGNVDAWYELCSKVRIFYNLGCEKGLVGELICLRKEVFFPCPTRDLAKKVEYFCRFGVPKIDVGLWILNRPEILNLDLESKVISVSGLLKHFGLAAKELRRVRKTYAYVFGRNKIANLPYVAKALDLHEWCFDRIKRSNGQLLASYSLGDPEEDSDKLYVDALKRIEMLGRSARHMKVKAIFLSEIGFGENAITLKVLKLLHGNSNTLFRRFDCLIGMGIKHSELCLMIRSVANILNMSPENLVLKTDFLRQEMGSLDYLHDFPDFLCYEFENRIKRRYNFYAWLRKNGLYKKKYSIATMLSVGEVQFIERLSKIHPAAPKRYLEFFSYNDPHQRLPFQSGYHEDVAKNAITKVLLASP